MVLFGLCVRVEYAVSRVPGALLKELCLNFHRWPNCGCCAVSFVLLIPDLTYHYTATYIVYVEKYRYTFYAFPPVRFIHLRTADWQKQSPRRLEPILKTCLHFYTSHSKRRLVKVVYLSVIYTLKYVVAPFREQCYQCHRRPLFRGGWTRIIEKRYSWKHPRSRLAGQTHMHHCRVRTTLVSLL